MRTNFKKYVSIFLALCLAMVLVCLAACKDNKNPEQTTPNEVEATTTESTTPEVTTPEATTPATPSETVTFPSDEDNDPKQEDNFFE